MSAGIKGVSAAQDARYVNKEKKLLRTLKFPKEYDLKVDLTRVNWEVMKVWIAQRVTELLGIEDDVLIAYIYEQLEGHKTVDPRQLQINLTGFLEKNTSLFCKELWLMLASAAGNDSGIPQAILDAKAEEVRKRKEVQDAITARLQQEQAKRDEEARARAEEDRRRRREEREREERARHSDRDRDRGRSGRGGYDRRHDRKRSRSPDIEAERRRRRERRSRSRSHSGDLPPPPRGVERHRAPDDDGPLPPPPARGGALPGFVSAADAASLPKAARPVESETDEERKKREKREKKEKKRLKKEKKKAKKEAKEQAGRSASPSSSSDHDPGDNAQDDEKRRKLEEDLRQQALQKMDKGGAEGKEDES